MPSDLPTARPESAESLSPTLIVALVGIALFAYYAWIASHFTWNFSGKPPQWKLYSALWTSLAEGRFDLNPSDIPGEGFLRDGKTYSYYGLFPAVLRGLVSPLRDWRQGGLPQLSCALAAAVMATAPLWAGLRLGLQRSPQRAHFLLFVVTIALGTPALLCLGLTDVYDEAVLWGAAWAVAFQSLLVLLFAEPADATTSRRLLLAMSVAAGLSLHSRATTGLFVLVELGLVFAWRRRENVRLPMAVAAAFVLLQAGVNYERWGNPLEFRPIQLHQAFQGTERGRRAVAHGLFAPTRVMASACYYFLPEPANLLPGPPYLSAEGGRCLPLEFALGTTLEQGGHPIHGELLPPEVSPYYDLVDGPRMPLPVVSAALVLLALLGAWIGRRSRAAWLLLLNGALTLGLLLTLDTLALRYEVDLVPALIGLGLVGVTTAELRPQRWMSPALAVLVACSVLTAHATLLIVKLSKPGVPRVVREDLERRYLGHER